MSAAWYKRLFGNAAEEEKAKDAELEKVAEEKATEKFVNFTQSSEFQDLIAKKAVEVIETKKREKEEAKRRQEEEYRNRVKKAEEDLELLSNKMKDSDEPWVNIVSSTFDPSNGIKIKLDWNDAFIRYLRKQGIQGDADDAVVKVWLAYLSQDIEKLMMAENYLHSDTAPQEEFTGDIDDLLFGDNDDEKDDFARWDNIIHRTFHANNRSGEPDDVVIDLCIHSALTTMNSYFRTYKADEVVITFDSYSWRKLYTKDLSKCVTNKKYKAHRQDNKTPNQHAMRKLLEEHIDELCEMLQKFTSILVLKGDYLEGDDLIAAYVQMHRGEDIVIMSGDRDMMQLLRYDHVKQVDPATGKERTLTEWDNDADLFMFEKCIRGESKTGDNVQSSYPRLRKNKIVKAFHDEFERENIMNHTFTQLEVVGDDYEEVTYNTRELFDENRLLMDLTAQPNKIKAMMAKAVLRAKEERGKYNHYKFLGLCGKHGLDKIVDNIEQYTSMLSV